MKKLIILLVLCIAGALNIYAQNQQPDDTDEQIIVNKEYDENGNLIKYDSTYIHQWSSDSTINLSFGNGFPAMMGDSMINSLLQQFGMSQKFDFSPFFDQDFLNQTQPVFSDSTFINHFNMQAQMFDFFNDPGFEQMQKQMQEQLEQFNRFMPQFQNENQQKEWENLMEKQRKEQEEFLRKLEKSE